MIIVVTDFKDNKEVFVRAECTNTHHVIKLPMREIEYYQNKGIVYFDFKINSFILRNDYDIILKKEKD